MAHENKPGVQTGRRKKGVFKSVLNGASGSTLTSVNAFADTLSSGCTAEAASLPHVVCGIMGPSGAGKTCLLDCLAGRKTAGTMTGSIRINGQTMAAAELRLLSGYVIQSDILPGMLTVRECLEFQSKLRVSGATAQAERVDMVLTQMMLQRQQTTLVVGSSFRSGISGGEKRRVSVAIELLSEPAVLFLDEPTTGQDATTAVVLCRALHRVAREGTTVVMSIHQPRVEIFEMLTQVIFLTSNGQVAYCGPASGLQGYISANIRQKIWSLPASRSERNDFEQNDARSNPADIFLDAMTILEPEALVNEFLRSSAGVAQNQALDVLCRCGPPDPTQRPVSVSNMVTILLASRGKHQASLVLQFKCLSIRALRSNLRNPFPFVLHALTALAASVAIGLAFRDTPSENEETAGTQNRFGVMFFLVLYLSLLSLTSLATWREDQELFVVERGSGLYSTVPYAAATILFDVIPYRLIPPAVFTLISYPLIGFNDRSGARAAFFFLLAAANLAFSGICLLVGVLTNSNSSANAAGSLAMLTSLLFSGFLLSKEHVPTYFQWFLW